MDHHHEDIKNRILDEQIRNLRATLELANQILADIERKRNSDKLFEFMKDSMPKEIRDAMDQMKKELLDDE
jgi:hypothetical protein